jgi:hypothetical protein
MEEELAALLKAVAVAVAMAAMAAMAATAIVRRVVFVINPELLEMVDRRFQPKGIRILGVRIVYSLAVAAVVAITAVLMAATLMPTVKEKMAEELLLSVQILWKATPIGFKPTELMA